MRHQIGDKREAGMLVHITSLPSEMGIGDFESALRFIDFLVAAGMKWWQYLPLGPTDIVNSMYASGSSWAGNRLLVSPRFLMEEGDLTEAELEGAGLPEGRRVDFEAVKRARAWLLPLAAERFYARGGQSELSAYFATRPKLGEKLQEWALFSALQQHYGIDVPWSQWDADIAMRTTEGLETYRRKLDSQIRVEMYIQLRFFQQLDGLRARARSAGISLIGDLPVYVALQSADVWCDRQYFQLDGSGKLTASAGASPDKLAPDGRNWNNPLYNFDLLARERHQWWIERMGAGLNFCDVLRVDHFRAFHWYYVIPLGANAKDGYWARGPGEFFFECVREAFGDMPFIGENLGTIDEGVNALLRLAGIPGMQVPLFGFDGKDDNVHHPSKTVWLTLIYSSIHDTPTVLSWWEALEQDQAQRDRFLWQAGNSGRGVAWDMMTLVMNSNAALAMVSIQDVLGLGDEGLMNVPGEEHGNWGFRLYTCELSDLVATRQRSLAEYTNRI